ncbi:hypothetical protein [Aneurinibacillus tyrosinisolvens]|uniref:hypothetical protein n=1 Tax=Aneurinibacillus tyrosinisolvens TaxID=1443435 RepID=UPI00063F6DAF|nr:hypothetical protein [Aneurinibacillus tyrosinisolvens]
MTDTYPIALTALQLEILLDTVRGFVDNKKLVHLPAADGGIVGVPLTEEALEWVLDTYQELGIEEKSEMKIHLSPADGGKTEVTVAHPASDKNLVYYVDLNEFDEQ